MAEIYPNGTIQIYSGIKLDNTYQHCLSFGSRMQQLKFFSETPLLKHTISSVSYQRITSGVCELQIAIGQLYDCNYMRFQNAGFSNKWFYAFITNVEYVNNITSRIYFEIDVNTTYYFDWNYLPSFIEREHVTDDTRGLHTINEPVNITCIKPYNVIRERFTNWKACVYHTKEAGDGYFEITKIGDLVNATKLETCNVDTAAELQAFRAWLEWKTSEELESIVGMFLYPGNLTLPVAPGTGDTVFYYSRAELPRYIPYPTQIDGYTPHNNKLLTYPYCYLGVDNGDTANSYKFEDFGTRQGLPAGNLEFKLMGCPSIVPEVYAVPCQYKGQATAIDERMPGAKIPQIAYPIDSFKAWLAQTESNRQNKVIRGGLGGIASGAASGATAGSVIPGIGTAVGAIGGAILGGITGAVGGAISNAYDVAEAQNEVNHVSGSSQGSMLTALSEYGFNFKYMGVKAEEAQIIDNFFDLYGYQVNIVKTPNIRSRAHWNYLKTNGCNMSSQAIPAEYVTKIKQIHDKGVTFWKSHDEIGNYGLDNRI